ncbi:MAG: adenylate/guanylate cyclase domain-containing protein, partial [Verrucomicrobiota bacterium]
ILFFPVPLMFFDSICVFIYIPPISGNSTTRRQMPLVVRIQGRLYPSFTTQVLLRTWDVDAAEVTVKLGDKMVIQGEYDYVEIPINERGEMLINYRPDLDIPRESFFQVAEDLYAKKESDVPLPEGFPDLEQKIILVGVTVQGLMDQATTPLASSTPPIYTYFQSINNILEKDFLTKVPPKITVIVFLIICWLTLLLFSTERVSLIVGIPLLTVIGYVVIALYFFNVENMIVDFFWPTMGFILIHIGSLTNKWIKQLYSEQQLKSVFSSYIAPTVMNQLLEDPENIKLGGVRKPVTVFFSDVRSFTTLSESMNEETLVTQLNEYFGDMVGCVNEYKGTLHKYIGDAIMAVWGDVVSKSVEEDAQNAIHCALAMRIKLETLNEKWTKEERPNFRIGMGLNHGQVLVGNIGAQQRQEFTVIGDAVNLASRLEGVTKMYRTDLIIGETVYDLLEHQFLCRCLGNLIVKGKTKPVRTYEVLDSLENPQSSWNPEWIIEYASGFELFMDRQFDAAIRRLETFLTFCPNDYVASTYVDQAKAFIDDPPPDDWQGEIILKSK